MTAAAMAAAEQAAGSPAGDYAPGEPFGTGPMPVANFGTGPMPVTDSGLAEAGTTEFVGTSDFGSAPDFAGGADFGGTPEFAGTTEFMATPAVIPRQGQPGSTASAAGLGAVTGFGSPDDVIVPPAEHVAAANRLPIFEAVESDWFRRGRSGLGGWPAQSEAAEAAEAPEAPEAVWSTPSDQGWEAAAAVSSPSTGGTTSAGLPKRVPQANLVPGTATPEAAAPAPVRSAAATRERFASFQRGIREGRAALTGDDGDSDGDDGSR